MAPGWGPSGSAGARTPTEPRARAGVASVTRTRAWRSTEAPDARAARHGGSDLAPTSAKLLVRPVRTGRLRASSSRSGSLFAPSSRVRPSIRTGSISAAVRHLHTVTDAVSGADDDMAPGAMTTSVGADNRDADPRGSAFDACTSRCAPEGRAMAVVTMRQLLESGVHFGHQTRRWNPKMKRFIFTERNGIYIVDLQQSLSYIDRAYDFVSQTVAHGGTILFVGTKKQAQEPVADQAARVGMPYVNQRWLGGMLTNFSTVHKRLQRLKELEQIDFDDVAGSNLTKKELLVLRREKDKLAKTLGGIRDMAKVPSAVWIVDTNKEHLAVNEARKLGIPVVAILDTNCDPDVVDYPIPGNDDAIRAVQAAHPRDRRRRRRRSAQASLGSHRGRRGRRRRAAGRVGARAARRRRGRSGRRRDGCPRRVAEEAAPRRLLLPRSSRRSPRPSPRRSPPRRSLRRPSSRPSPRSSSPRVSRPRSPSRWPRTSSPRSSPRRSPSPRATPTRSDPGGPPAACAAGGPRTNIHDTSRTDTTDGELLARRHQGAAREDRCRNDGRQEGARGGRGRLREGARDHPGQGPQGRRQA